MAKVVVDNQSVVAPWRSRLLIIIAGVIAGISWWVLTGLLEKFVIEPLACSSSDTLSACGDAIPISGSVAAVLTAVLMLIYLVMIRQARPILIASGAAAVLWGLGLYTAGMQWYESLVWAVLLYVVVFLLFGVISRIRGVWSSLVVALLTVVIVRVLVAF